MAALQSLRRDLSPCILCNGLFFCTKQKSQGAYLCFRCSGAHLTSACDFSCSGSCSLWEVVELRLQLGGVYCCRGVLFAELRFHPDKSAWHRDQSLWTVRLVQEQTASTIDRQTRSPCQQLGQTMEKWDSAKLLPTHTDNVWVQRSRANATGATDE